MAFKDIAGSFGNIVAAVKVMLTALPIGQDDKARIDGILSDLETAAEGIAAQAGAKITVRKSDVIAAVEAVLPALVEEAVKKAMAAFPTSDVPIAQLPTSDVAVAALPEKGA